MNVGGDSNIQIGKNINYKKTFLQKPEAAWRRIWIAVVAGLVVAAIVGAWKLLTK